MIILGDYVRDKETNFEGLVIGIAQWLGGYKQVCIKHINNDNTCEMHWSDEIKVEKTHEILLK